MECGRFIMSTWQNIQAKSLGNLPVTFSIFHLTRNQVESLCGDYRWLHQACYSQRILDTCANHPFLSYFESNLNFACNQQAFFENFECVKAVTHSSTACERLIRGVYLPNQQGSKCQNSAQYFRCMANNVKADCNETGLKVFQGAMEKYGCSIQPDAVRKPFRPNNPPIIGTIYEFLSIEIDKKIHLAGPPSSSPLNNKNFAIGSPSFAPIVQSIHQLPVKAQRGQDKTAIVDSMLKKGTELYLIL